MRRLSQRKRCGEKCACSTRLDILTKRVDALERESTSWAHVLAEAHDFLDSATPRLEAASDWAHRDREGLDLVLSRYLESNCTPANDVGGAPEPTATRRTLPAPNVVSKNRSSARDTGEGRYAVSADNDDTLPTPMLPPKH